VFSSVLISGHQQCFFFESGIQSFKNCFEPTPCLTCRAAESETIRSIAMRNRERRKREVVDSVKCLGRVHAEIAESSGRHSRRYNMAPAIKIGRTRLARRE
jgi:hypothetical protein